MTTIGKEIYHLDCVDSTNNFAAKLINDHICQNGSVILADEQTAGKGQMGNTWESTHSYNLLCSIVWKPDNLSVSEQSKISWMVCLALHKLLLRFGIDSTIKWPNDVYVGTQKIAGILIENQLEGKQISWVIAGIGLNVNQCQFESPNATSINLQLGRSIQVKTVLNELIAILNGYIQQWDRTESTFKTTFESLLFLKDELAVYTDSMGEFEGKIIGVEEDGRLSIAVHGENRSYALKEVQFLSK